MTGWRWAALGGVAVVVLLLPWVLRGPEPGSGEALSPALASLRSPEYDPRFGFGYWEGRFARGRDGEVARALRFCRGVEVADHPNCRTVLVLEAAGRFAGYFEGPEGAP